MKKRKRPFLLLEVIISFAIVVGCILPLIYPHVVMYKSKKQFEENIQKNHVVNLLYVDILEKLHRNEIAWQEIEQKKEFPFERGRFKGSYKFEENHKPPDATGFSVAILQLSITLDTMKYEYEIFAGRRGYATNDDLP